MFDGNAGHIELSDRAAQTDWSRYFAIAPPPTRDPRAGFITRMLRTLWSYL